MMLALVKGVAIASTFIDIDDMKAIKQKYTNILEKLITKRVNLPEFKQALKLDREDVKTIIYFK